MYVILRFMFEIIFFVSIFSFIITCTPCLCFYFKFSKKDKEGYTELHLRVRRSLVGDECAICLEEFLIN